VREDADGFGIFGDGDDGEIGDGFGFGGDVGEVSIELPLAGRRDLWLRRRLIWIGSAAEGEMGVPPLEFAVSSVRVEGDVFAGIFGDVQAEVGVSAAPGGMRWT